MNDILLKVQAYLDQSTGASGMSQEIISEAAEHLKDVLNKHFNKTYNEFRLRPSNIGRPLCQLQLEKQGVPAEKVGPWEKFNFLIGDLIEVLGIAILKAADVGVQSTSEHVSLDLDGFTIQGEYDVKINDAIWDIKSCSSWAFDHKFQNYTALKETDTFGYIEQLYTYAEAANANVGGWIVINKANGTWNVLEAPE